ncbi:MAG: hypothetical protein QOG67_3925 [Verrucomicrobiota bacterium]|jgi:tetratricopeptide (TPR) repeat protein
MTTSRSAHWLCLLLAIAAAPCSVRAESDTLFAKANEEYAQKHYEEAVQDYESLVSARQWSAPLFYNLGNAYFRNGDFARAILSYERALALDPHHPEAAANLSVARDETRALELQKTRPERWLKFAATNQLTITGAVAFWIAAFSIAAMFLVRRRSIGLIALSILALSVAAAAAVSIIQVESAAKSLAIVTRSGVTARVATADNAKSVLTLPPGSEIRIMSERGDWIYALLPNNLRGWVPGNSVESVRL